MSIQAVGMRAYSEALRHFNKVEGSLQQGTPVKGQTLFARTLDQTLLRDSVDRGQDFGAQADFIRYPTTANTPITNPTSFTDTVKTSLNRVNTLDNAKNMAIDDFASGRNQNVHELMISMQKSSLAMKLTSAVRGKVLEAYKEISKMQF
ncbi:MAG: flagellar hook-basal body complex protein FliE [Desulfovibrio sp.]|jgi:flagellar hook-basal body complex protein FliE|uniref:flagellar hook-basal body complex protein FliE n=1 Tax=uncultured Desulfovibrio sp. TaxID=167968 RepID=UPI001B1764B0|nr:flagellar hook-basal body complex protein FliE [uncultured Desulfovibrio sp.]MBE6441784.1 flagellar hook-basal body complex protein FliE [Desulfovibrio desulfuricans]MBO5490197.1 flagellar hook-basal body complex protein FliE [Desulfovibrio sp.]MBO6171209.1 flagellar hook-basal body complex protein FliE [Desulfovibrio sp.]